ncbi:MAG: hypothetical protein JWQ71_1254 [Pedosphaera sp.]|nr:hypothetical protein [Pedosphaera sp.]
MKKERKTQDDNRRARVKGSGARQESGVPGGGRGRRDVVRGSGVYPASGPLPRSNAPIRTEAAWGQGSRGAAGYEDSGSSELNLPRFGKRSQTTARRGASTGRRQPAGETGQEIPRSQWERFFDNFSRNHDGWLARVEVSEAGAGSGEETRTLPLHGITVDTKSGANNTTSVILGLQPDVHLTHMIPRTKKIIFNEDQQKIEVESSTGDTTIVHFKAPRRR